MLDEKNQIILVTDVLKEAKRRFLSLSGEKSKLLRTIRTFWFLPEDSCSEQSDLKLLEC